MQQNEYPILHIYSPSIKDKKPVIEGNKEGLVSLANAILQALANTPTEQEIFDSVGNPQYLIVTMKEVENLGILPYLDLDQPKEKEATLTFPSLYVAEEFNGRELVEDEGYGRRKASYEDIVQLVSPLHREVWSFLDSEDSGVIEDKNGHFWNIKFIFIKNDFANRCEIHIFSDCVKTIKNVDLPC